MTEQQILERAEPTLGLMRQIEAEWSWDEMAPAAFEAKLAEARAAQAVEADKKSDYDLARGQVNAAFADLEARKTQGIGMAKFRFRAEGDKLEMVNSVGEYGTSREDILRESGEWAAAWQDIAPTWTPTTSNTLAAFGALMQGAAAQNEALTAKKIAARRAGVDLAAMMAQVQDICVAWYGQATRVFPAGSPLGDLIRGQIPTFSDSGTLTPVTPTPAPIPPTP